MLKNGYRLVFNGYINTGNAFVIHFCLLFQEADEAFGAIAVDGDAGICRLGRRDRGNVGIIGHGIAGLGVNGRAVCQSGLRYLHGLELSRGLHALIGHTGDTGGSVMVGLGYALNQGNEFLAGQRGADNGIQTIHIGHGERAGGEVIQTHASEVHNRYVGDGSHADGIGHHAAQALAAGNLALHRGELALEEGQGLGFLHEFCSGGICRQVGQGEELSLFADYLAVLHIKNDAAGAGAVAAGKQLPPDIGYTPEGDDALL